MTEIEPTELDRKIDIGIKAAVAEAIKEHHKAGRSIPVWRDGQVMILTPDQIVVRPAIDTEIDTEQMQELNESWINKPNSV